jgi:hypothetical protein
MTSVSVNFSGQPMAAAKVSAGAVNNIPPQPMEKYYVCTNPPGAGITPGTYFIQQFDGYAGDPLAHVEIAIDEANPSNMWIRRATAVGPPAVWGAWSLVGGGAAAVTTFTGAQGNVQTGPALVATAGDYNASMITYTPSGNVPPADVTVQSALDYVQIYAPMPASSCGLTTNPTVIPIGAWTVVPTTFQPLNSRSGAPGGSWAAGGGGNGVTDIQTAAIPATRLIQVSASVSTSPIGAAAGTFGLRIMRSGVAFAQNIVEDDRTGAAQLVTVCGQVQANLNDVYTIQVINNTTAVFNIVAVEMFTTQFGRLP